MALLLITLHKPKFHLGAEAARLMLRLLQSVLQSNRLPEPQLIALRSSNASPSGS
jgi:DNA-binding LacI/PurR family transcriptional regulator